MEFDKEFQNTGLIIGTDEVGRGPVAGPVAACAVCFKDFNDDLIEALKYLDDSKKFSSNPQLRKELSEQIKSHALYSIQECSVKEIEKYNISKASLLAMKKACVDLLKQINTDNKFLILVDGKFKIPELKFPQKPIIKGDAKSASIAAASILAKVYRDDLMEELSLKFPEYNWQKNKGYPTQAHLEAINEHGLTCWHRKTFLNKILTPQLSIF